ncbi:MAG: hypothetical protein HC929_12580 [Leptolyngbyaceae cyanobacterium SM2_5_2]|nr:hypothetical protein [Leptolyngbyaceae cyanobacterium SM2_5_2]
MERELTAEEQQELANLRKIIAKAMADGVLTEAERLQITTAMRADGQITYEELELVRQLCKKVAAGDLQTEP